MVAFAGDDISALVLEVGTSQTRAGYAGDDLPKSVFQSQLGFTESAADGRSFLCGQKWSSLLPSRENLQVGNPLKDGQVVDWEAYEQLWTHAFTHELRVDPTQMPLMLCEPSSVDGGQQREQREKMAELAFETFQVPAFFMANQGVLSAFSAGRSSALIVDIGAGVSSVTPVHEGYALRKGIMTSPLAGQLLSEQLALELEHQLKVNIIPTYRVIRKKAVDVGKPAEATLRKPSPTITDSFDHAAKMRVVDDLKESVCAVSEAVFNQEQLALRPQRAYEFPDGFNFNFGAERFKIPEILFDPSYYTKPADSDMDESSLISLPRLAVQSIESCDLDVRAALLGNVILTGGSSLFPNMTERFHRELMALAPGSRVKVYAAGSSMERRFGPWIGGSILASLGTFQQMWVSKQEYEEEGFNIIEKRCQ